METLNLRMWVLLYADTFVAIHILLLTISLIPSGDRLDWLFEMYFPKLMYTVVSGCALCGIPFLYVAVHKLNSALTLCWIVYMAFLIQIPCVQCILATIFWSMNVRRDGSGPHNLVNYLGAIVIPLFCFCFWLAFLLVTGKFLITVIRFNSQPNFLRRRSDLMMLSQMAMRRRSTMMVDRDAGVADNVRGRFQTRRSISRPANRRGRRAPVSVTPPIIQLTRTNRIN